jgi:uncharacterized phage protein (TIGR02218 family)
MKTIPPSLATHLAGGLTTLAYLLRITRADGTMLGFTSHDRDLLVSGISYKAADSFSLTEIAGARDLAASNGEVLGMISSTAISDSDIKAGRYDNAAITLLLCNWADTSAGSIILRTGRVGTITHDGLNYRFELIGLLDTLEQTITQTYTRTCRYRLGDTGCTINLTLTTWRKTGTLSGVTDTSTMADTARTEAAQFFTGGTLSFTSGLNNGLSYDIKNFNGGVFTLWQPTAFTPAIGDAYVAVAGCDKTFATCTGKFSNSVNFGGFPHIPGADRLLQTPDAKVN